MNIKKGRFFESSVYCWCFGEFPGIDRNVELPRIAGHKTY